MKNQRPQGFRFIKLSTCKVIELNIGELSIGVTSKGFLSVYYAGKPVFEVGRQ